MATPEIIPLPIRRQNSSAALSQIPPWPQAFDPSSALIQYGETPQSTVMLCHAESEHGSVTLSAATDELNPFNPVPAPRKTSLLLRLWLRLEQWHRRWIDRRLLAEMDDRMLKDMGISSADALKESSKPFWLK